MSCRGVHFALTNVQVDALKAQSSDPVRLEFVQEDLEETFFAEHPDLVAETDKAWDAIHRVLTDGRLEYDRDPYPLSHVILGGERLYQGDDYIMTLKTPDQVRDVAAALGAVTEPDFRARYMALDPDEYDGEIGQEDYEYTWSWFSRLREFWLRVADRDVHVLFTVDQ